VENLDVCKIFKNIFGLLDSINIFYSVVTDTYGFNADWSCKDERESFLYTGKTGTS
jgi:hypothetical protein